MLKRTYKFLNTLIPTISKAAGSGSLVRTPLLQARGWGAHLLLLAMHILLRKMRLLSLFVHQCSSLLPANLCAGEKAPHKFPHAPRAVSPSPAAPIRVSPTLLVGQGGCCIGLGQGHGGSGLAPGSIQGWGLSPVLSAFPPPGLTPRPQVSFHLWYFSSSWLFSQKSLGNRLVAA